MERLLTRNEVLRVLKNHGIESFTVQTGTIKSQYVKEGTSFAENVGVKMVYTVKEVKNWLGY